MDVAALNAALEKVIRERIAADNAAAARAADRAEVDRRLQRDADSRDRREARLRAALRREHAAAPAAFLDHLAEQAQTVSAGV